MDSEEVYLGSVGKLASLVGTSEAALKILLSIIIGKLNDDINKFFNIWRDFFT